MPKMEFEYLWRLFLVLAVVVGIAAWQLLGAPAKRRAVQRAIDAAVTACDKSWGPEFDRRLAEASSAVDALDPADREMYKITLDNQLIAHHCK